MARLEAENHRALAALEAGEARFRDIVEVASDWIWETDADLRVTWLSDSFEQATGIGRAAALGSPLEGLFRAIDGSLEARMRAGGDPADGGVPGTGGGAGEGGPWRPVRDVACRL